MYLEMDCHEIPPHLREFFEPIPGAKAKDMALIPERFILAAQAQGWWVRSKTVWALPNTMPESVKDRPTDAYQMIYMLTKSERYWWDQEAIREFGGDGWRDSRFDGEHDFERHPNTGLGSRVELAGRNARNVQTWSTESVGGFHVDGRELRHFAAFPQALPEWCIRASCPAKCCRQCGAGYAKVVEHKKAVVKLSANAIELRKQGIRTAISGSAVSPAEARTLGFKPSCSCPPDLPTTPGLMLDPFLGRGTTALAAQKLGRRCWGIDISADYIALSWHRLQQEQPALEGLH